MWALWWTLLLFCSPSAAFANPSYEIEVGANLDVVVIKVRWEVAPDKASDRAQRRLLASNGRLNKLRWRRCDTDAVQFSRTAFVRVPASQRRGSSWQIPVSFQCVEYRYPLEDAGDRDVRPANNVWQLSTPTSWLWLPTLTGSERVQLRLILAPGVKASVPWQPRGPNGYVVGAAPGSGTPLVVFGDFMLSSLRLGTSTVQVAQLPTEVAGLSPTQLKHWLLPALNQVAAVGADFPMPFLQVVVFPVNSDDASPVPFGHVIRDQGTAVRFFVAPDRTLADMTYDWTATHEFAHLLLPYMKDKWVSEGFASYYQNILQFRAGEYSEVELWQRLQRYFGSAAAIADPPRSMDLDQRSFWEVRMLVYWRGAALALAADIELRRRSNGAQSLDTVLGQLARSYLPATDAWSAQRLFKTLDELAGDTVFVPLWQQSRAQAGMPDYKSLFKKLGVRGQGERLILDSAAPLAQWRKALITSGHSSEVELGYSSPVSALVTQRNNP